MEMFELRYFLRVAQTESLNRAAESIHVSPGSLSKAITRLEAELQTPLFFKSGRGIRLTPEGMILKKRAAQILQLEEDARLQLTGPDAGSLNVHITSEEILQTSYGTKLVRAIGKLYPNAKTNFLIRTDAQAVEQVMDGDAHLALITMDPPAEVASKVIAKVEFKTCASREHPLMKKYSVKQAIPVEELLEHAFVSPESAILGKIASKTAASASIDGWRDDKFPRKIKYKVCGLKLMENLIQEGLALGYLPDYFVETAGLTSLKITGCPYSCHQTVRVIARDPSALGWLDRLWDEL
jgi:DNA-binding transcriptional LysR family regulator